MSDNSTRLLTPFAIQVYVYPNPSQDVRLLGLLQGVSLNLAQTVDRLITIGTTATLPFAGYYSAQFSVRKFLIHTPSEDISTVPLDLQSGELPNPIHKIMILVPNSQFNIVLENAYWNAHSISAQAGQILVLEDVSFECEDVIFIHGTPGGGTSEPIGPIGNIELLT